MSENLSLDAFDRRILDWLHAEGRITITELAHRVGLSKTPCLTRVRRLEKAGYILGYSAVLNTRKLGRDHVAFVEVKLTDTREAALRRFNAEVRAVPEIEECHMIAGGYDYLLKVRSHDINAYRRLLGERISSLPHVAQTSTHVAMETVKDGGREGDGPVEAR